MCLVEKGTRSAGVGDLAIDDLREVGEFVGLGVVRADDVEDLPIFGEELVSDEAAVALPGEGFGAHDHGAGLRGDFLQFDVRGAEFVHEHVVGIRGEGGDAPRRVWRVSGALVAPAAERAEVSVLDVVRCERGGEGVLVELRVAARARQEADVGDVLNFIFVEEREEVVDRAVRVADRVKCAHREFYAASVPGIRVPSASREFLQFQLQERALRALT
jgi:hypothetical protein